MNTRLDKFGRIVIPKSIRDRLGLAPGERLRIEVQDSKIVVDAPGKEPQLVTKEGLLVIAGHLTGSVDDLVEKVREERLKHVSGREDP